MTRGSRRLRFLPLEEAQELQWPRRKANLQLACPECGHLRLMHFRQFGKCRVCSKPCASFRRLPLDARAFPIADPENCDVTV